MDAVIGAPFSNSIFAFFESATGMGHRSSSGPSGHPYYRALYQPDSRSARTLAKALLVVFDSVYVTPWDFPIPGRKAPDMRSQFAHFIPELDMTLDWSYQDSALSEYGVVLHEAERVSASADLFVLPVSHELVEPNLRAMSADLLTSAANSIPLVCGPEWLEGYYQLGRVLSAERGQDPSILMSSLLQGSLYADGVGAYAETCGMTVETDELEILGELRSDGHIFAGIPASLFPT